uniref:RPA interacting protein n=1 Tax=Dromaius novaehollandiae TaxID=8790 RepID=A0A8C4JHI3_DRONO
LPSSPSHGAVTALPPPRASLTARALSPQRCVERLRNSRAKLLDRYRQAGARVGASAAGALLVREVMEQEWQALRSAPESLPMLEDPDELAVLEEIQRELVLQEQLVLEEYERSLQFDEECLNAMLDGLDASDKIICPVCRNAPVSLGYFLKQLH